MRVYVQVPVTGRKFEEALRECDERCVEIAAKGHDAVNPLRALDFPENTTSREAIGKCVALLMTCDAIYAHPNVTNPSEKEKISSGCLAEACAALAYGLKFIYDKLQDDKEGVDVATECDDECAKQLVATTALYKVTPHCLILRDRNGDNFGSSIWGNVVIIAMMLSAKINQGGEFKKVFEIAQLSRDLHYGIDN